MITSAMLHRITARLKALTGCSESWGSGTSSILETVGLTSCNVVTEPFLRSKLGSLIVGILPDINEGLRAPVLKISVTEFLRGFGCSGVYSLAGPLSAFWSCSDR